mmetsp:Transcript_10638/g.36794  ORF Transcript_10638/g.36794 Transcript_10638/m.36794 type:complete len:248 (-) Transcript_10638:534-1277(-)
MLLTLPSTGVRPSSSTTSPSSALCAGLGATAGEFFAENCEIFDAIESKALRRPSFSSSSSMILAVISPLSFLLSSAYFSFWRLSLSFALDLSTDLVSSSCSSLSLSVLSRCFRESVSCVSLLTVAWDLFWISRCSRTSVDRHSLVARFSASLARSSSCCRAAISIWAWHVPRACLYWSSASSLFSSVMSRAWRISRTSCLRLNSLSVIIDATWTRHSDTFHALRSVLNAAFCRALPTRRQVSHPPKL